MDGGAWWAAVHAVAKSRTQLSDFIFPFHFPGLEKEMATHPSVLAWRIPGTGEPGGMPSMGLHRVGHDWSDLAAAAAAYNVDAGCIKHWTHINSFHPLNNPASYIPSSPAFYRWVNWGTEPSSHFPKLLKAGWYLNPGRLALEPPSSNIHAKTITWTTDSLAAQRPPTNTVHASRRLRHQQPVTLPVDTACRPPQCFWQETQPAHITERHHVARETHGTIKKTQRMSPQSASYLVHAVGTAARTQTCHGARQLLKVLPAPAGLTSWSRQLHCNHKEKTFKSSPVSRGTFCHDGKAPCPSSMVATSHMLLPSTWMLASATEGWILNSA